MFRNKYMTLDLNLTDKNENPLNIFKSQKLNLTQYLRSHCTQEDEPEEQFELPKEEVKKRKHASQVVELKREESGDFLGNLLMDQEGVTRAENNETVKEQSSESDKEKISERNEESEEEEKKLEIQKITSKTTVESIEVVNNLSGEK